MWKERTIGLDGFAPQNPSRATHATERLVPRWSALEGVYTPVSDACLCNRAQWRRSRGTPGRTIGVYIAATLVACCASLG